MKKRIYFISFIMLISIFSACSSGGGRTTGFSIDRELGQETTVIPENEVMSETTIVFEDEITEETTSISENKITEETTSISENEITEETTAFFENDIMTKTTVPVKTERRTETATTFKVPETIATVVFSTTEKTTEAPVLSSPSAGEVRKYILANIYKDENSISLACQKFADLVKEKTGGSVLIEVSNNGLWGIEQQTVEETLMGNIHFSTASSVSLAPFNYKFDVFSFPYLYRDTAHMYKVLDGEIGNEFLQLLNDDGLTGLTWFDTGGRNFYNSGREIKTPADMAGLKIRVQETRIMLEFISNLGALPTPMPLGDVYAEIQLGKLDGSEAIWETYDFWYHDEVAKYITLDSHIRVPQFLCANNDVWEQFSQTEKKIISEAAYEASLFQRDELAKQENDYRKKAVESGCIITELTAEERQKFIDVAEPIYFERDYTDYLEIYKRISEVK